MGDHGSRRGIENMAMGTAEYVVRRPGDLPGNRFAIRTHGLRKYGKAPFQPVACLAENVSGRFGDFSRPVDHGIRIIVLRRGALQRIDKKWREVLQISQSGACSSPLAQLKGNKPDGLLRN